VPTFREKLTWANGDGAGLRVVETPLDCLGVLICGENTNPLARFALMAQGEHHSFEAKAFNIVASGFFDAAMREELATLGTEAVRVLDESPRAVSVVIGPTGEPVSDLLSDHEGLLYASIDTRARVEQPGLSAGR